MPWMDILPQVFWECVKMIDPPNCIVSPCRINSCPHKFNSCQAKCWRTSWWKKHVSSLSLHHSIINFNFFLSYNTNIFCLYLTPWWYSQPSIIISIHLHSHHTSNSIRIKFSANRFGRSATKNWRENVEPVERWYKGGEWNDVWWEIILSKFGEVIA